ncbi:fumarylacetoacetate hydrolase family protein [Microvirga sp. W0021]|uniref:Fumarylacetoacetate hydrolase family protein n=1 Tax=Hohaiivirga grylli TaxID=3133970 RepID=A0ABV0BI86_9HYPH
MRFVRFGPSGQEKPGVLDAQGVIRDISSIVHDIDGRSLAAGLQNTLAETALETLPVVPETERLGPCIGNIRSFIGVGMNYADHALETGAAIPTEPVLFNKAPSCINGPNDDIIIPRQSRKTDWEVELAIVIGKRASYISSLDAPSVIAGYCICNDLSEREFQMERGGTWNKGKSCPTFGPLGPWFVTADEIKDTQKLDMWLDLNGERMQTGNTSTMIFTVPYIVSYISQFMILEPGDVITTGTPPGVGMGQKPQRFLKPGDKLTLGIEGLGSQSAKVIGAE